MNKDRRNHRTPMSAQGYIMVVVCLFVGLVVGYFYRGSAYTFPNPATSSTPEQETAHKDMAVHSEMKQRLSPEEMKSLAEQEAASMIEQFKSHPKDADLAARIGNLYYDAQMFPAAIEYFQKSLTINEKNSNVRIDMATALFNNSQTERAMVEINRVLQVDPTNVAALFNRGLMKWQGKKDTKGAIADWESILHHNPNNEQAERIRDFIARAQKRADGRMQM